MTSYNNLTVIKRYNQEVMNKGNIDLVDELLAEDYEHGTPPPGMAPTRDGFKQFISMVHNALSNYTLSIEDTITAGEKVIQRWTTTATHTGKLMGVPASGNRVEFTGISIYLVQNDKLVKDWTISDMMTLMQQIGAVPEMQ